jgi:cytoplasmic iron level regulating protein YaaA (DUF328/UPF0246 family)
VNNHPFLKLFYRLRCTTFHMLFIISPAKALDFSRQMLRNSSDPIFVESADKLAQKLQKKSTASLRKLFQVSENIAQLNHERFQNWHSLHPDEAGNQALHAFNGHVYQKIDVDSLSDDDLQYANKHLRILSGMYGLLKPSDLILPHRLEMGTKWPVTKRNLYGYWREKVTKEVNRLMREMDADAIINLASNEYFKVLDRKGLKAKVIDMTFLERRPQGAYATVSIFAKQARGSMCRFAFQNKVESPEELKGFDRDGYTFSWERSSETNFVFTRG